MRSKTLESYCNKEMKFGMDFWSIFEIKTMEKFCTKKNLCDAEFLILLHNIH